MLVLVFFSVIFTSINCAVIQKVEHLSSWDNEDDSDRRTVFPTSYGINDDWWKIRPTTDDNHLNWKNILPTRDVDLVKNRWKSTKEPYIWEKETIKPLEWDRITVKPFDWEWKRWKMKPFEWDRRTVKPFEWNRWTMKPFEWDRRTTKPFEWNRWTMKPFEWNRKTKKPFEWNRWTLKPFEWDRFTPFPNDHKYDYKTSSDYTWLKLLIFIPILVGLFLVMTCKYGGLCNKDNNSYTRSASASGAIVHPPPRRSISSLIPSARHYTILPSAIQQTRSLTIQSVSSRSNRNDKPPSYDVAVHTRQGTYPTVKSSRPETPPPSYDKGNIQRY